MILATLEMDITIGLLFAVVALITVVATIRRPMLAVLIVMASIPFEVVDIGVSGLTLTKAAGLGIIAALGFVWITGRQPLQLGDSTVDLAVAVFVLTAVVSSVVSPYQDLGDIFQLVRLAVLYIAVRHLTTDERDVRLALATFVHATSIAAILGIVSAIVESRDRQFELRAGGVSMDPNDFALLASVSLFAALQLAVSSPTLRTRRYWFGFGVISFLGVVFAGSRAGLLTVGVVGAVWLVRQPQRRLYATVAAGTAVAALLATPQHVRSRLLVGSGLAEPDNPVLESAAFSVDRRSSYLTHGLDLFAEKPILGWGYESFEDLFIYSEFARFDNPQTKLAAHRLAHNVFVEVAVGGGVVGLVAWLALIIAAWAALARRARRQGGAVAAPEVFALQLTLMCMIIGSLFLSTHHDKMWWIAFAFAAALDRKPDPVRGEELDRSVPEVSSAQKLAGDP